MSKHVDRFWLAILSIIILIIGQTLYFSQTKSLNNEALVQKKASVSLISLPDLSVASEARFIRFRSLSDVYSAFNEGPELMDYFPAAFVYAPSPIMDMGPSKVTQ